MRIPDFDDIALSDRNAGLEDDTIVNEDPFAEVFGTPSMFREPSIRRFTDEELDLLTVKERQKLKRECITDGEICALRDILSYDFKKYGNGSLEYYLPALSYLYYSTGAFEDFEILIKKNSFILFDVDPEVLEISEFMANIGIAFPELNPSQLDTLEELYNNTKYCEMIDDVVFNKDRLPRKISGITRDDLERKNSDFPDTLLDEVYHAFEMNDKIDNDREDTLWYIYVRRLNRIVKKTYNETGAGECLARGVIDACYFFRLIEEKYGTDCANFFVGKVKLRNEYASDVPIEDYKKWKSNWTDYKLLKRISTEYNASDTFQEQVKRLISLAYLQNLN